MTTQDRKITITVGSNRWAKSWRPQTMLVSELYERLRTPARSPETMQEYLSLKKKQQDDLKDVGGFIGGPLSGPRRKRTAVAGRDVVTLDLDNIHSGGTADVLRQVASLGYGYCVYSTRKHTPTAPRLRLLFPLDRTVSADEYEPIARRIAERVGLNMVDPTTFEAHRLMYWPSCCADGEYIYITEEKPLAAADSLLATYEDWCDITQWPQIPGATQAVPKPSARQEHPEGKKGPVGAFCRKYNIYSAIHELLPDVYEPVDTGLDRYTYTGGSTTGGAIVYDNGAFLYSHHATDPCGGMLVNSFDMVRLHKFGNLDDEVKEGTPGSRLPSYIKMCEFAMEDDTIRMDVLKERWTAVDDFADLGDGDNWYAKLQTTAGGKIRATMDNVWFILENDPRLKGRFAMNTFAGYGEVLDTLPWNESPKRRAWEDSDYQGIYWYLEKCYGITGSQKIDGALALHSVKHAFNDVKDYLTGLSWDGARRLDTLFVDYLGAEDNAYTRAVTRKALVAAVARVMAPGCKFDYMTILAGPQGIGKSTMLFKLSRGFFNDNIRTFEGKEASELLRGVWLIEISELDAFRRTDVDRIKQFLSLRADRFRAAYDRHVKEVPRCCVFFGSTNNADFLQDLTGNRRFWPIDVGLQPPHKNVFTDLDGELDQIWAEATARWQAGEPLFLSDEVDAQAREVQEAHRERSPYEGMIQDFLEQQVPADWSTWDLAHRQVFWSGNAPGITELVDRKRVCAIEVWVEALHQDIRFMKRSDAAEINKTIARTAGWKRTSNAEWFGPYKSQRGFTKEDTPDIF